MMLFSKLRRSAALFICPELRTKPQPVRVGYDGSAAPMKRAALDAAYEARSPEERGFFNADEARAHSKARKDWIGAERARMGRSGVKPRLIDEGVLHVKSLYPVIEESSPAVALSAQDLRYARQTESDRFLAEWVAGDHDGGRCKADLDQKVEGVAQALFVGGECGHHSSPSVDACSDASPSSGGCE